MKKIFNKRIKLIIFTIALFILINITLSFSYLSGRTINNESVSTVALKAGNIQVRYTDNSGVINATGISPGYEIIKQFTVTSEYGETHQYYEGDLWYTVSLVIEKNEFDDNSLKYSLSLDESSDNDGLTLPNLSDIGIPTGVNLDGLVLGSGMFKSDNKSHKYNLTISYPDNGDDQSHEIDSEFKAYIGFLTPDMNELTIDLDGGSIDTILLDENSVVEVPASSTINLPTPTKDGYTFMGWEVVSGDVSANNNVLTTNLSDIRLKASWLLAVYEFDYTGGEQEFIAEVPGYYKLEAWGAQGGNSSKGGKGGYSSGVIKIELDDPIYIYVGGVGPSNASVTNVGGYNGGGYSGNNSGGQSYGGGGATDFRLINGNWNDASGLKSRILIAAGGAGSVSVITTIGGAGGGLIGGNGTSSNSTYNTSAYLPVGSNQTSAGFAYQTTTRAGSFGYAYQSNTSGWGGGGGGGYYGGGNGHGTTGAGGSSYISGHTGCVAIVSNTSTSARTGTNGASCTTGTSDNLCSVHYSGKVFTDTVMIDGAGYSWTNTKGALQQMPNPSGGYYDSGVGHSGNGYARITYLHS